MTIPYKISIPYTTTQENIFNFKLTYSLPILELNEFSDYIPKKNENYFFNPEITESVLIGLLYNKKTLIHGLHGCGKSSIIEQVAANLNWPVLRLNFDGFINRFELVGRDQIKIKDGKQITEFAYGLLPWVITKPFILILDEYDAARAELLFILQRLLENNGKFTLFETNEILIPHSEFRIFATCNTSGNGDEYGIYPGTNILNQAQLDRWNIVISHQTLATSQELEIINKQYPNLTELLTPKELVSISQFIELLRKAFYNQEISTFFSTRSFFNFIENIILFKKLDLALSLSFTNKLDSQEKLLVSELYLRCFDQK